MFSVDPAWRVKFTFAELFKYNDAGVDTKQLEGQSDLGLPVSRCLKPRTARRDGDIISQARIYFVDDTYQYGLSARGTTIVPCRQ